MPNTEVAPSPPNTNIIVSFKKGDRISFQNSTTNSKCMYVVVGDTITLSKGVLYSIPIDDPNLNLAEFYAIKDSRHFADSLLLRYVADGIITVYSLRNGVIIKTGDTLGTVI